MGAVSGTTAALIGIMAMSTAASAAVSINAGNEQADALRVQAQRNARIQEDQAKMVAAAGKLQGEQDDRAIARAKAKARTIAAGSGLEMGGSPLALMIDLETQMEMDKQITQYNYAVQERSVRSGAANTMMSGMENAKLARAQGYSNAYTNALNNVGSFAIARMGKL